MMNHRELFEAETGQKAILECGLVPNQPTKEYCAYLESLQPPLWEYVDCSECGGDGALIDYQGNNWEGDYPDKPCTKCSGSGNIKRPLYWPPEVYKREGFELNDDGIVWIKSSGAWITIGFKRAKTLKSLYPMSYGRVIYVYFQGQSKPTGTARVDYGVAE